jgi:DNA-binding LacI/PurR family transcriptional regulator
MAGNGAATTRATAHITAGDIAARLGLAPTTVSHVLAGRGDRVRIKAETQRRVLDAARELGYRPNASARAMRTGRFGSAALIQPLHNVFLPADFLLAAAGELERQQMHLSVAQIPDEVLGGEDRAAGFLPKVVRELTADGLLINMIVGIPDEFVRAVRAHQIPTVFVNSRQARTASTPTTRAPPGEPRNICWRSATNASPSSTCAGARTPTRRNRTTPRSTAAPATRP